MKKILICSALTCFLFTSLFAQNFSKVEVAIGLKKWGEAYTELQKLKAKDKKGRLSKSPKNNYFLGFAISQAGIASSTIPSLEGDYRMQGFEYLKRAYELDKNLPNFMVGHTTLYKPFWDIYASYYQEGVDAFNAKSYLKASEAYELAGIVGSFVAAEGMGLSVTDTNLIYLKALNYINLQDVLKADPLIKKVVMIGAKRKEGFEMLKWLLGKYLENKEQSSFNNIKVLAETHYPEHKEDLWDVIGDEYAITNAKSVEEKIKVYEDLVFNVEKKASNRVKYNYIIEVYSYLEEEHEDISDERMQSLINNMHKVTDEVYMAKAESQVLYLYSITLFKYTDRINTNVSKLRKELRVKAAPVKGKPSKGSQLEKQINQIKAKIDKEKIKLKNWSKKGFPLLDTLIGSLKVDLEGGKKSAKSKLGNALDIAAGLAYSAGLNDKGDLYEQQRTKLLSH